MEVGLFVVRVEVGWWSEWGLRSEVKQAVPRSGLVEGAEQMVVGLQMWEQFELDWSWAELEMVVVRIAKSGAVRNFAQCLA